MTDRELMQQALDALRLCTALPTWPSITPVIEALRARLAQPEQEPVAWRYRGNLHEFDPSDWAAGEVMPLYTTPPQREWVGLTKEEAREICVKNVPYVVDMVAALEARLKEKNHDCYK